VNQLALQWICSVCEKDILNVSNDVEKEQNLVELYCGNGNHTVALAKYFEKYVSDCF
jgi:tRNA/tmRNA/rRNA uracil-C5-methylase (TrmA/RlmC/RlmD family)